MDYLHAALTEAMRLYPPVPVDFKEALADDVLPDGTPVRARQRVIYYTYAIGRDPASWGDDAAAFRPERWMRGGAFAGGESPFKYAVFNAGPRLCIGKRFAYTQMKTAAAAVLSRFAVEVVPGQEIKPKLTTTLYMKNGLMVRFRRRPPPPPSPPPRHVVADDDDDDVAAGRHVAVGSCNSNHL
uniref:Cytochrome P450 n=2 Tax=Oryza TaxID=4527 RepID=A0A0D3F754_9ORYZ